MPPPGGHQRSGAGQYTLPPLPDAEQASG